MQYQNSFNHDNPFPYPVENRRFDFEKIETRQVGKIELRNADADGKPILAGYAAVFDSDSEDFGGWKERIAPGAFARDLADKKDIRALINHDTSRVIGRSSAGTLNLEETDSGLYVEISLPDTTEARDLLANVKAGNIDGMSFGFRARDAEWAESERADDGKKKKYDYRILKDVELIEVSAVAFPAYPATSIAHRSYEQFLKNRKTKPNGRSSKSAALELDLITQLNQYK
jgi:hypothetical protein